jgi:hypothetical protein
VLARLHSFRLPTHKPTHAPFVTAFQSGRGKTFRQPFAQARKYVKFSTTNFFNVSQTHLPTQKIKKISKNNFSMLFED